MSGPAVPVAVLAVGSGVVLVWSAFTGQNPLTELRKVLTTGDIDGPGGGQPLQVAQPADVVPDAVLKIGTPVSYTPEGSGLYGPRVVERVPIGQGGHKLAPAAATAFRAAEMAFGRSIPVTDSSRDYEHQAAQYKRDPSRFGPPDGNAHVEGRAVDVNLSSIGANPQGEPPDWMRDGVYAALVAAMTSAGWCNYQLRNGTAKGRTREPWHFAYGRCN